MTTAVRIRIAPDCPSVAVRPLRRFIDADGIWLSQPVTYPLVGGAVTIPLDPTAGPIGAWIVEEQNGITRCIEVPSYAGVLDYESLRDLDPSSFAALDQATAVDKLAEWLAVVTGVKNAADQAAVDAQAAADDALVSLDAVVIAEQNTQNAATTAGTSKDAAEQAAGQAEIARLAAVSARNLAEAAELAAQTARDVALDAQLAAETAATTATAPAQGMVDAAITAQDIGGQVAAGVAGKLSIAAARPLIVFDGDSMTAGSGVFRGATYPALTADGIIGAKVHKFGVAGQNVALMLADAATQIDPLVDPTRLNVLCLLGGTNDLNNGAASAETVYTRIVTYCQARRAAGFKVIVGTVLPRDPAGSGEAFEADRQSVNTSIRANWATFADALADVGADILIGSVGAFSNMAYFADGTHPTSLGCEIIASYYRAALESFGVLLHGSHVEESLWVPATRFGAFYGGAALGAVNINWPAVILPPGVTSGCTVTFTLPPSAAQWRALSTELSWTVDAIGGNTLFRVDRHIMKPDKPLAMVNGVQTGALPVPPVNQVKQIFIDNPWPSVVDPGAVQSWRISRMGASGASTSTANVALLGLSIAKAS